MHFPAVIPFALTLLSLTQCVVASPASERTASASALLEGPFIATKVGDGETPDIEVTNSTLAALSKRQQWCREQNESDKFSRVDAQNMANSLRSVNPERLHEVLSVHAIWWTLGTAMVCVRNHYVFENTHVKEWEVGWGIDYVLNECCSGQAKCSIGSCTGHGDSGLAVEILIKNSAFGSCF